MSVLGDYVFPRYALDPSYKEYKSGNVYIDSVNNAKMKLSMLRPAMFKSMPDAKTKFIRTYLLGKKLAQPVSSYIQMDRDARFFRGTRVKPIGFYTLGENLM
jgi:hypothetical protein